MKCATAKCRQVAVEGDVRCSTHRDPATSNRTCAAGPCRQLRQPGQQFCAQHGAWGVRRGPEPKAQIVCPHCQTAGRVQSTRKLVKRGVSGGKATGAVLTGGLSLLATGLSRKVQVTAMHCKACDTKWTV